ncbi:hypothetical protein QCA50_001882 [Cerrena zonata]|uniref:EamA domain-containing protein n=1 Tax=Cerrena zonata TaxID=2478898 RepID=A0AAW0GS90_9APHY
MSRHPRPPNINLGGTTAAILFACTLFGFVIETQLTQYVQSTLDFRQPYLIFYIVHSFFSMMFPAHFLYLSLTSKSSPKAIWNGLMLALRNHIAPAGSVPSSEFPRWRFLRLILFLTGGMTVPSLCWFAAVPLAPVTDVTALWNTNAFWAYIVTVKLFKLHWEPRRLSAVVLATAGAMAVVYGGSTIPETPEEPKAGTGSVKSIITYRPGSALVGDVLTLVAAIVYGVYQVLYKMYATLPGDPEADLDGVDVPPQSAYEAIPEDIEDRIQIEALSSQDDIVYPPPFALFPNMLTSTIGVCTFLFLWVPMPIMQSFGWTTYHLPANMQTVSAILGIALSGLVFNAGFMILLGLWGPILTSIGSLLTIVLVFISDIIFGGAVETITMWSLLGCGSIVVAFSILAYDMMQRR